MKRIIASTFSVLLLAAGGVLVTALPASAHESALSATFSCDPAHSTYTISWTGTTSNAPNGTTADATLSIVAGGGTLTPSSITGIAQNAGYSFTQNGVAGTSTEASVTANLQWSDGFPYSVTQRIALPGDCVPTVPDADAALTVTPSTCTTDGSAAWTTLTHATAPGLDQTPGAHSGTATSDAGHTFPDGTTSRTISYEVAARIPEQSTDASAPCYVKPPSGLAETGPDDVTVPVTLAAIVLAAGGSMIFVALRRRRFSGR